MQFSTQVSGRNYRQGCFAYAVTVWCGVVCRCPGPGTVPAPLLINLRIPGAAEGFAPASAAGFSRSPRGGAVGRHRVDSGRRPLAVTWSWRWRDLGHYSWPLDLRFRPEFLGLARCFPKKNSAAPRSGRKGLGDSFGLFSPLPCQFPSFAVDFYA